MYCEYCGANNQDGAKFCSGCGAPLQADPAAVAPVATTPEPYPQPQRIVRAPRSTTRRVSSMVIYFIAGGVAIWTAMLIFLPQIAAGSRFFTMFDIISNSRAVRFITGGGSDLDFVVSIFFVPFMLVMQLQIVWAILSFLRVRPAGVFGLIASIIYTNHATVWAVMLTSTAVKYGTVVMPIPYLMAALGMAGIVLSILQLSRRSSVR